MLNSNTINYNTTKKSLTYRFDDIDDLIHAHTIDHNDIEEDNLQPDTVIVIRYTEDSDNDSYNGSDDIYENTKFECNILPLTRQDLGRKVKQPKSFIVDNYISDIINNNINQEIKNTFFDSIKTFLGDVVFAIRQIEEQNDETNRNSESISMPVCDIV